MNATQAAASLGIQLSTLYMHIKRGNLRATKDTSRRKGNAFGIYEISPADLEAFRAGKRSVGRPRTTRAMRESKNGTRQRLTTTQKLSIIVGRQYYCKSLKDLAAEYQISESGVCHAIHRNAKNVRRYNFDEPNQAPNLVRLAEGIVIGDRESGFSKVILWTPAVYDMAVALRANELFTERMNRATATSEAEPNYTDCVMDADMEFNMEMSAERDAEIIEATLNAIESAEEAAQ
jgi:hypothetical protein